MPEQEKNTILSNNRIDHNTFIAFIPVVLPIVIFFLLVILTGMVVFFIVDRASFLAFMPGVFTWAMYLIGAFLGIGVLAMGVKYVLGGFIIHVIGAFIQHVVVPLKNDKVHYANDNFVAYSGKVNVSHHGSPHHGQDEIEVSKVAGLLPPPTETPMATGRDLLMNGKVKEVLERGEIIVGYLDNGSLDTMPYDELYSIDLGGVGGSGKTTTAFWLCIQEIMSGTKLIVVDPHLHMKKRGGSQGLGKLLNAFNFSFQFPPCDTFDLDEVMKRLRWMDAENKRRQRPGYNLDDAPQIMMVIDEFNSVIEIEEIRKEIGDIIARVQREGRKFGLFFLLVGHRWSEQDIGNIKIRTNAATVAAHYYNDESQAGMLIGKADGKKCLTLKKGSYWLRGLMTGDLKRVRTPLISEHDIPLIFDVMGLPTTSPAVTTVEADPYPKSYPKSSPDPYPKSYPAEEGGNDLDRPGMGADTDFTVVLTDAQREKLPVVAPLIVGRKGQGEILKEAWGIDNVGGRPGREATEDLRNIHAWLTEHAMLSMKQR